MSDNVECEKKLEVIYKCDSACDEFTHFIHELKLDEIVLLSCFKLRNHNTSGAKDVSSISSLSISVEEIQR